MVEGAVRGLAGGGDERVVTGGAHSFDGGGQSGGGAQGGVGGAGAGEGATTMKRDTRNTPLGREDMLRLLSLSFYPKPARVHFVALFRDEAWAGLAGPG